MGTVSIQEPFCTGCSRTPPLFQYSIFSKSKLDNFHWTNPHLEQTSVIFSSNGTVSECGGWKLHWITNENDLICSESEWNDIGRFSGLGCFIDDDCFDFVFISVEFFTT